MHHWMLLHALLMVAMPPSRPADNAARLARDDTSSLNVVAWCVLRFFSTSFRASLFLGACARTRTARRVGAVRSSEGCAHVACMTGAKQVMRSQPPMLTSKVQ